MSGGRTKTSAETPQERWNPPDLGGRVAVVTGASRGIGRGVAEVLGECGATVYIAARSTRESPTTGDPEQTVEAAAEEIERRGGTGVAVRCDFGVDADVERLFAQVEAEQGRLDLLVNNVVGWGQEFESQDVENDAKQWVAPMWERSVANWDGNMHVGLRSHFLACRLGIPLMLGREQATVVFTGERPNVEPNPDLSIDVRAHATARFALTLAGQLERHRIASLVVYPGFPRTEGVLESWEAGNSYFDGWTHEDFMAKTESPHYGGRAIAMLAGDADVMSKSGQVVGAHELARSYDFTDVDGRQPVPVA